MVEPPRGDRIGLGIDPRHLEIGRQPQRVGQERGPRAEDVVVGDHEYGGGRLGQRLRPFGDRSYLDLREVFDRKLAEIRRKLTEISGRRCAGAEGDQQAGGEDGRRDAAAHAPDVPPMRESPLRSQLPPPVVKLHHNVESPSVGLVPASTAPSRPAPAIAPMGEQA